VHKGNVVAGVPLICLLTGLVRKISLLDLAHQGTALSMSLPGVPALSLCPVLGLKGRRAAFLLVPVLEKGGCVAADARIGAVLYLPQPSQLL